MIDKNISEKDPSQLDAGTIGTLGDTTTITTAITTGITDGITDGMSVEIESICFAYPSQPTCIVLKNVSMYVHPNKITAFAGKSGSGKSSLLSIIAGLYTCHEGSITVGGLNYSKENHNLLKEKVLITYL